MTRLLVLVLFAAAPARAEGKQLKGTLYELDSDRKVKLFTWELLICGGVWTSKYFYLDGTVAVEVRVEYAGSALKRYSYVRHRIGERSSVTITGKQLAFKYARGDVSKSETKTTDGVFLTGAAVFPYIEAHLAELQAGKELEFKFGALDMLDYFSFTLSSESPAGSDPVRIRVRAKNIFVRLAISPIYVTLSRDGKFKGITGRTILMEAEGSKMMPIDADLVVDSETRASCGDVPTP